MAWHLKGRGSDTRRQLAVCRTQLRGSGDPSDKNDTKGRPSLVTPLSESALYHPTPRGPLTGRAGRYKCTH